MLFKKFLYSPSCEMNRFSSSTVQNLTSSALKERSIKIKNFKINYLKVGNGAHHVFCFPGVMGTIWSHFKKQIEGFDLNKFSLVIWDAPGFGKSIALDNDETLDQFSRDADIAYEFMKALQIPCYSTLGWSNGGCVSLVLASRYPHVVDKAVVWALGTFLLPHETKYYNDLRDLNNWSKRTREKMIELYGEENLRKKIEYVVSGIETISNSGGLCSSAKKVKCPTFILYGAKDPIVDSSHLNYISNLIKNSRKDLGLPILIGYARYDVNTKRYIVCLTLVNDGTANRNHAILAVEPSLYMIPEARVKQTTLNPASRTYTYPDGEHNIHIRFAEDFNKRVQEFLLEPNNNTRV